MEQHGAITCLSCLLLLVTFLAFGVPSDSTITTGNAFGTVNAVSDINSRILLDNSTWCKLKVGGCCLCCLDAAMDELKEITKHPFGSLTFNVTGLPSVHMHKVKSLLDDYADCTHKKADNYTLETVRLGEIMDKLQTFPPDVLQHADSTIPSRLRLFGHIVEIIEKRGGESGWMFPKVGNLTYWHRNSTNVTCAALSAGTSSLAPGLSRNCTGFQSDPENGLRSCFAVDGTELNICRSFLWRDGFSATKLETLELPFFARHRRDFYDVWNSKWTTTLRLGILPAFGQKLLTVHIHNFQELFEDPANIIRYIPTTRSGVYPINASVPESLSSVSSEVGTDSKLDRITRQVATQPYKCVRLREIFTPFHYDQWDNDACISYPDPSNLRNLICKCDRDGTFTVVAETRSPFSSNTPTPSTPSRRPWSQETTSTAPTSTTNNYTKRPTETSGGDQTTESVREGTLTPTWNQTSTSQPMTTGSESPTTLPIRLTIVSYALLELSANFTEDSMTWLVEAPEKTLSACLCLISEQKVTGLPISFNNVVMVADIVEKVVDRLKQTNDMSLLITAETMINTTIEIYNILLQLDVASGILQNPGNLTEARETEQRLYAVLETVPEVLKAREEPYEFYRDLISVNILRREPRPGDDFASVPVKNFMAVKDFRSRVRLDASFKSIGDGEPGDTVNGTGVITDYRLSLTELKKDFEAAKNNSRTFSVMLSVLERFRYAHFDHSEFFFAESKSRKISPIMFLAKLDQPLKEEHAVVFYTTKVDDLIKTAAGERFHGKRNYACVYFDYNKTSEIGGWSTKGCRVKSQSTTWEQGTTVECECDHLTPFTLFFYLCSTLIDLDDVVRPTVMEQFSQLEPRIITTFSLSISIACILVVLLHTSWKLWRRYLRMTPLNFTRLNVVISLLTTNITVLVAEYIPEVEDENTCFATALMSHWFMMSSFFWMMAETYFLVKIICGSMEINHSHSDNYDGIRWQVALLAWGVPIVFPLVSGLSHIESFTEKFGGRAYGSLTLWCWIDPEHDSFFLGAFVVPICVIALLNISVFAYYLYKRREAEIEAGQKRSIKQGTISVVGMCLLLGATWISGYFMLMFCCDDTAKKVAGVFFILLNGAQGVFVLWVYVTRLDGGFRYMVNDFKHAARQLYGKKENKTRTTLAGSRLHGRQVTKVKSESGTIVTRLSTFDGTRSAAFDADYAKRLREMRSMETPKKEPSVDFEVRDPKAASDCDAVPGNISYVAAPRLGSDNDTAEDGNNSGLETGL